MADNELPDVPDNPGKTWHSIVKRPNELKKKVPTSGGIDPTKAFDRADKIIKQMSSEYLDKLKTDIDELEKLGATYVAERSDESLERLFSLVHNMRGQGTTFGYPLITDIGRSFCRYVKERPPEVSIRGDVVDQHVAAMRVVYKQSIQGNGDEIAKAVVQALQQVVTKEIGTS